jgi:hypothetical protein
MLFNMYAEHIMREAGLEESSEGLKVGGRTVNNLRYADDTTLAAQTKDDLVQLIEKVKHHSESAGLYLNISKTKILTNAKIGEFVIKGEKIEIVHTFNLLGSSIDDNGGCYKEITRRLTLGRIAMSSMSKIWKDTNILKSTKARLVRALVFPIALYGCESWTTRKAEKKKIASFENWCWRRMLRVSWTNKRTNASINEEIGSGTTLLIQALKQKLSYFGHVVRADGLEKSLMLGMGEGKRSRGRPRARWIDEILERTELDLREATQAASNRTIWRSVVNEVTRGLQRPDGTRTRTNYFL